MPKGGRIERKRKDGGVSKVKKTGAKTEKTPPKLQRFQGTLKEGQTLKNIDGVTYVFSNGTEFRNGGVVDLGDFKGSF